VGTGAFFLVFYGWIDSIPAKVSTSITYALVASLGIPTVVARQEEGALTQCKGNFKEISTALEMYSCNHEGHYPHTLAELLPNYLKKLPICPAAERDSYSATYVWAEKPDGYTFCCSGEAHCIVKGIRPNYPQYTAFKGLIAHPPMPLDELLP
jgi:hypothetical protein